MAAYLFTGWNPATGCEPWVYDRSSSVAVRLGDLMPGTAWGIESVTNTYVAFGVGALFAGTSKAAGNELWYTDGTPEGTHRIRDLAPGVRGSGPEDIVVAASGLAYFAATTFEKGTELWVTDGTTVGTRQLGDLLSGPESSAPHDMTPFHDGVILRTDVGPSMGSIWYANQSGVTELTMNVGGVAYGEMAVTKDVIPLLPQNPNFFMSYDAEIV